MPKLKIITLTIEEPPEQKAIYRVYEDGKLLSKRVAPKSCKGTTYIAALVTKNITGFRVYSIRALFCEFHRISKKKATKTKPAYAIAVREDHKEAFEKWRVERRKNKKEQPTLDFYASNIKQSMDIYKEFKEQQPGILQCPKCENPQEHTYPMSGKLFCNKCGELLDEIYEDE